MEDKVGKNTTCEIGCSAPGFWSKLLPREKSARKWKCLLTAVPDEAQPKLPPLDVSQAVTVRSQTL